MQLLLGLCIACTTPEPQGVGSSARLPEGHWSTSERPFEPIPEVDSLGLDPRRVELGRRLFQDRRISGGGDRSCVDCHDLHQGGVVPGESRSNHPLNLTGPYNVPTVYNVGFNFRYNWQGRFETLEAHLGGPMFNENVMNAGSWADLQARLHPYYQDDFVAAGFPDGVDEGSLRSVLADYQRSLITPNAPFDRFLRGEQDLPEPAARGFRLFCDLGCSTCHQGLNVGGNLFQRFGVMADPYDRPTTEADLGRRQLTGRDEDDQVFRVPSLRNVALTAPYFHDGSAPDLHTAVQKMARVQLGYVLDDDETADLVAFLETLTAPLPEAP